MRDRGGGKPPQTGLLRVFATYTPHASTRIAATPVVHTQHTPVHPPATLSSSSSLASPLRWILAVVLSGERINRFRTVAGAALGFHLLHA